MVSAFSRHAGFEGFAGAAARVVYVYVHSMFRVGPELVYRRCMSALNKLTPLASSHTATL